MAPDLLSVLVIDDDAGDRMSCQRALESALGDNLVFMEADCGEAGLKSIEIRVPNCVLLDCAMPGISGVETLKRIRAEHPYLPVIMIDGKGNDILAVQSMKEGAQDYIAKTTITSQTTQRAVQMAIEHCALQKHVHEQRTSLEIFTRALAHDLKEPVRTIRSFLDQIADWYNLNEESQQSFRYIRRAADRMNALIDTVYLYTRLDAPEQMPREHCDLNQIMEETQENLAQLIEERGATITGGTLPGLRANRVQMIQMFQNLLANAIRHCDTPVTIHVSSDEHEHHWQLIVHDDGPGIAPEHFERIFDPFKRLSQRKEDAKGLGLGLAINRKIVESHGGKIWCESQLGAGASFLFTLPKATFSAAENGAFVHAESPRRQVAREASRLARILMVDDNEDDIELNRRILIERTKLRCDLLTAHNGKVALVMLQHGINVSKPIDLLLLDNNMPVMTGLELLSQMQAQGMLQDTDVIMCTTSDCDKERKLATSLGALGYLTKPPQFSMLKEIIGRSQYLRLSQDHGDHVLHRSDER